MPTYYTKACVALNKAIYDVNPAQYGGIWPSLGKLEGLEITDPWNIEEVHYNMMKKAVHAHFGKDPMWADADSIFEPAVAIPVWANWSVSVPEKIMKSIDSNPTGHNAQTVRSEIIAQQNYFVNFVDKLVANYLSPNPTTSEEYVDDYVGCFRLKAATGTIDDPEDCNSTAGTITATGIKVTGAAMAVDAVSKAFDVIRDRFPTFVDTYSKQRLTHGTGADRYTVYMNPEVWSKVEGKPLSNASGEVDFSQTVDRILSSKYEIIKTYAFDDAYDGVAATVSEYAMALNTRENFVCAELIPYAVHPWEYFQGVQPSAGKYRLWGGMRFIAFPAPHYINSAYKKAFQHASFIPYATA